MDCDLCKELGIIVCRRILQRNGSGKLRPTLVWVAAWRESGRLDPVGEISKPIPPPGRACPTFHQKQAMRRKKNNANKNANLQCYPSSIQTRREST